jgi:hypothetical protein
MAENIPKGCIIVGWQMRYNGWPPNHWEFLREHPGEIPEAHAPRKIRPVYARIGDEIVQKNKPIEYKYSAYDL